MDYYENSEKIIDFCSETLELDDENTARSMALACATLAGNHSNFLNLISTMIQAFEMIHEQ
jgi:hypothetical protein